MALGEAVAVGVDTALSACINEGCARTVRLYGGKSRRAIDAIVLQTVAQNIADLGIELRPTRTFYKLIDQFPRNRAFL